MLTSLFWSLGYHEEVTMPILEAALITIACGVALGANSMSFQNLKLKEGLVVVSLGWAVVSLFGSLPYLLSGYLPSVADALFETVSGFTTTGASVVSDVEIWPRSLLYWRSLTQWLGGMGIIALFVAIIAGLGARAKQLFKSEVPGPVSDSLSPRIKDTARKLWITYVGLSLMCMLCLYASGMDFFDSLCHTFTTMATGGFSTKNASIAHFSSPLIEWTIILFMFLAGVNFALHFFALRQRNPLVYFKNAEFKVYVLIILLATLLVFISLHEKWNWAGSEATFRAACFQIIAIVTTTGFATADFDLWPPLATTVILLMMFVGGCSGSTGGSVKPGRYMIIGHRTLIELKKMVHPKAIYPLRFGGRFIGEDLLINVLQFFFLYILFFAAGFVTLSALGLDLISSISAAATCLGNIGPGLNLVGPTRNFSLLPDLAKYVLSILMLVGRLEIYPVLVLFMPEFWRD